MASTIVASFDISDLFGDEPIDDIDGRPRGGVRIPKREVVTAAGPSGSAVTDTGGRVVFEFTTSSIEDNLTEGFDRIGAVGGVSEYRVRLALRQPSGLLLGRAQRKLTGSTFSFSMAVPRRRLVILDIDGLRWDTFYRHLVAVQRAGASLDRTFRFEPEAGATTNTVIGDGKDLRSGLGFLALGPDTGRIDVRFARAPYPSFTFPSHATMFTGVWPNRHGIAGNSFVSRRTVDEWRLRDWEGLPMAASLHGFCTGAGSKEGAYADYKWFGLDESDEDSCVDRNRGLVSDLFEPTLYHHLRSAGRRTLVVHNFYHGAAQPWTSEGKDTWWHATDDELRTLGDVCSEEDTDQLEDFDSAAFVKAELALQFRPSSIKFQVGNVTVELERADKLVDDLDGHKNRSGSILGEPQPGGPPDLMTVYAASIDWASHLAGVANQATYMAWIDHRLARFVAEFRRLYPLDFNNTVFAIISDHGHVDSNNPPKRDGVESDEGKAIRRAIARFVSGDSDEDAIEGRFEVMGDGTNLYVYIRDLPGQPSPLSLARELLQVSMQVEPYGAIVRDDGRYRLLARGLTGPVDLDTELASQVISAHLGNLPRTQEEIAATTLTPAGAANEAALRDRLSSDPYPEVGVARLVSGFGPDDGIDATRSPDIVLLAPANQAFSGDASTHGSLAVASLRVPMMFCGPGLRTTREHRNADMVDFAPTVLSLLGFSQEQIRDLRLDGRPLVDFHGERISRFPGLSLEGGPRVVLGASPGPSPSPSRRRFSATLEVRSTRLLTPVEITGPAAPPLAVAVNVVRSGTRLPRIVFEDLRRHEIGGAEISESGGLGDPTFRFDDETASACDTAEAGYASGEIVLPRVLAVQNVEIELPGVPPWIDRLLRDAIRDRAPYRLSGSACYATTGSETGEGRRVVASVLLEAGTFCELVEAAASAIDGAAILEAHRRVRELMQTEPVADARAAAASSEASDRIRHAWELFESVARSPRFTAEQYDAAVAALRVTVASVPEPLVGALTEVCELVEGRSGRLEAQGSLGDRVLATCGLLERLVRERRVATLALPGVPPRSRRVRRGPRSADTTYGLPRLD